MINNRELAKNLDKLNDFLVNNNREDIGSYAVQNSQGFIVFKRVDKELNKTDWKVHISMCPDIFQLGSLDLAMASQPSQTTSTTSTPMQTQHQLAQQNASSLADLASASTATTATDVNEKAASSGPKEH